jgi:Mg2+ and Co2+ transporter CorA
VHIVLYHCDGTDQALSPRRLDAPRGVDRNLLWVDIGSDAPELLASITKSLELPAALVRRLQEPGSSPTLRNFGEYFLVRAVAVQHVRDLRFEGAVLCIAGGPGLVISVHHRPIAFIPKMRAREDGESHLGMLTADSFVASLLDWHLGTYFEAASDFGRAVEKLEEDVLRGRHESAIADLRKLRKGASRLRRMLAPHREVFASLARPDFRPDVPGYLFSHDGDTGRLTRRMVA